MKPRPRPRITVGRTVKLRVGCGSIYVTLNEDSEGLAEVFVRLGRSGGCGASQTEAIGRLISLALRSGIDPQEIIRQLKGIRCPYTMWDEGVPITSCADAVAKAIDAYLRGEFAKPHLQPEKLKPLSEFTAENSENGESAAASVGESSEKANISNDGAGLTACPECGGRMIYVEGCSVCESCCFSKCG